MTITYHYFGHHLGLVKAAVAACLGLQFVEVGNQLNLANDVQRVVCPNAIEHFLARNVPKSPGVGSLGRLDFEVTGVHIAEARNATVVHKIEAVFGTHSELNIQLTLGCVCVCNSEKFLPHAAFEWWTSSGKETRCRCSPPVCRPGTGTIASRCQACSGHESSGFACMSPELPSPKRARSFGSDV
jgi:hypothetical protein